MTLEQQIKTVIEAATAQLSRHLHERLQALATDVGQAASAEHGRGVENAVAAAWAEAATQLEAAQWFDRLRRDRGADPAPRVSSFIGA